MGKGRVEIVLLGDGTGEGGLDEVVGGKTGGGEDVPSGSHEVFGLDLAGAHLAILRALLDVLYQLSFLVFELDSFAVEFSLRFFEGALVFS